jgi:hypothetical protein
MVKYLVRSLRVFGGKYHDSRVVLTLGNDGNSSGDGLDESWFRQEGVEIRWTSLERLSEYSWYANALERFCYDFNAEMVLMLDADVLIASALDSLIDRSYRSGTLGGLIAHAPPFQDPGMWGQLHRAVGINNVHLIHEHTGWGPMVIDEALRYCPPYFNLGVLVGPAHLFEQIGRHLYQLVDTVNEVTDSYFRCQLALSLAISKYGTPYDCLPFRYNFPNDPGLERKWAEELPHAAILHLLREHEGVFKSQLFDTREHIDEFLARNDLTGINAIAQHVIAEVRRDVEVGPSTELRNPTTGRISRSA